jgi:hypothetical protein
MAWCKLCIDERSGRGAGKDGAEVRGRAAAISFILGNGDHLCTELRIYILESRHEDAYLHRVWCLLEVAIRSSGSTNHCTLSQPHFLSHTFSATRYKRLASSGSPHVS